MLIEIAVATLLAALVSDQQRPAKLFERAFDVSPSSVVHVRVVDPGVGVAKQLLFAPRIPSGWAAEDSTCPRVCFATTLSGALASIRIALQTLDAEGCATTKRIDVYTNAHQVKMGVPTLAVVPDAPASGELWALEPVTLTYTGSIDPERTEALAAASDAAEDEAAISRMIQGPGLDPSTALDRLILVSRDAISRELSRLHIPDEARDPQGRSPKAPTSWVPS